jgi:hypothetical protein
MKPLPQWILISGLPAADSITRRNGKAVSYRRFFGQRRCIEASQGKTNWTDGFLEDPIRTNKNEYLVTSSQACFPTLIQF